ncbi:MAG: hypothetical protein AAF371_10980, partial [Pseudomonadota bacterium]
MTSFTRTAAAFNGPLAGARFKPKRRTMLATLRLAAFAAAIAAMPAVADTENPTAGDAGEILRPVAAVA